KKIGFKSNILHDMIDSGGETLLGNSNYLINRHVYMSTVERYLLLNIYYHDAGCLTYLWLINGNYLRVIDGLILHEYPESRKGFYKLHKNFNVALHEYIKAHLRHDYRDWDFKLAKRSATNDDLINEKAKML